MADPRLDSMHFVFDPRRETFRRAREVVLGSRGMLTWGGEQLHGLVGPADDWPSVLAPRPQEVLPNTAFLLLDSQADGCYPLKIGVNAIGRLPSNDIVLKEHVVSRRHCVIVVHATGGAELHDMASRNGTFVNGHRLQSPVRLSSGDWVQVACRLLRFVSGKDYQAALKEDDSPATAVQ